MSLDRLRDASIREKKNEIANCAQRHKSYLRQLQKYTTLVAAGRVPQPTSVEPSEDELRFLDANALDKGRHFHDATLPFPSCPPLLHQSSLPATLPFQNPARPSLSNYPSSSPSPVHGPSLEEQLRAASASPSVANQSPPLPEQSDIAHTARPPPVPPRIEPSSMSALEEKVGNKVSTESPRSLRRQPSKPLTVKDEAVPIETLPDSKAALSRNTDNGAVATGQDGSFSASTPQDSPKAPQVVHLPSQEVQEGRLHETERKLDRVVEKERREDLRLAPPNPNGAVDAVSSPSSTVGAYSHATPHAPHHSPDTSPDAESFHERGHPTALSDDAMDPVAQQIKEDHERTLQKQMSEARQRAREEGSVTPDAQSQIEHEEAIRLARDGKRRLSDSRSGPAAMTQNAEELAVGMKAEHEHSVESKTAQDPAADSLPTPATTAPEPSALESDTTGNVLGRATDDESAALEHPTPPADIDIEMDNAPPLTEQQTTPRQLQPSHNERMISRGSSGRSLQKFVSEVNGKRATPKSALTPRSNNVSASVSPIRPKHDDRQLREISTVVFAKKNSNRASKALQLHHEDYASLQGASEDSSRDYLEGLFKYQAHHPPRSAPLQELVASARKTVSTAGTLAMIREHQDYKILKRVYQLQNANRWSLRQLQKAVEPERPFSHQDQLLLEMKWMQTDFREERRWKMALAATLAEWCADYVSSSPDDRLLLRVNARIPESRSRASNDDQDMRDAPTPDLVHSSAHETESESHADEDELLTPYNAHPPIGLFSLGFDDFMMKIDRTPASDTMFGEIPFYTPTLENSSDNPFSIREPPLLPVSKFVTGKLVSQVRGPPRKRSRYEYDSEDEPSTPPSRSGTSAEHSMPSTPGRRLFCRNDLPPEMTEVALFNTENKHVRDRLQAAHHFRPPTEFNMPSVAFFEHRTPSQWLWEEDQKLRALVKEYTFNWSLVSQQLSLPSLFVSGSGRRTPWECFERWVQLEGLPAEMSKTQYFRTYQGRLEQANKTVFAQYQAQQQQQQQQGQTPGQPRRRPTTTPIRVERRRDNRHLAIIDGMRKLARKRESAAHKQAESQKAAAMRKAHEPAPPKNNVHTPQEFSRLKWEREEKLRQRQQQEMNMRQQMLAQRQAQMQAQAGMANGVNQMQRNGTPGGNPNVPAQMANPSSQQAQTVAVMAARSQQGQQGTQGNFANGNMPGMSMGTPGVPQAQMQGNMQNAQRMAPPDQMRMAMQRGQFQNGNTPQQQQQQQQQQFQLQQQQLGMAGNLTPSMGMNNIPNTNMMASMSNQNLNGNMNGMANNAGSPRMNQVNPSMQSPARPLSSGHMPQLLQMQNTIKVQHPEWSPDQVQKVASEQLSRFLAKQRVQAMNAAAGSPGMSSSTPVGNNHYIQQQNGAIATSPPANAVQNYQQQLVQQQRLMSQTQRQVGSPGLNARPLSRSATPQNPQMQQQSPGMQPART